MDPSTLTPWIAVVSQVGFPIAVAAWLLLRTDRILNANTEAIKALTVCLRERLKP